MFKQIKILIIILLAVLLVGFLLYTKGVSSPADKNGQDAVFSVVKGESVNEISENLFNAGLIKSKLYFETYVWKNELEKKLQAGNYVLNPKLNIKEITEIFSQGEVLDDELMIKIIEGWRVDDIDKYLAEKGIISKNEFSELAKNNYELRIPSARDYKFLDDAPIGANLEGYLFPDTYRIFKDSSAEDIVKKMLDNFDKKLTSQMRDDVKKQNKTIYEIITMASIVEKEVRTAEDMKIVSGIFWDRVKNGQGLESCATLAYILGVNKPQYSLEDTKIDSPYNTYKNQGLPPSPISNPGLNAIMAAIYPKYTDYNYFLSRPDTGETVFSKTYDEHLGNKAKYLK
jgi:UPF0755 protein